MAPSRPPVRSALALLCGALAFLVLPGCGPLEDAIKGTNPEPPIGGPPPPGFATEMVDAHNAVRADVASVGGAPAPSPALPPLAWSTSAAATAQAWADGCRYQHNAGRGELGENIAAAAPPGRFSTADVVIAMWASEAPYYDYASNTCNTANPPNEAGTCGHYTQVVWRGTTVVGCGKQTCSAATWPFGGGTPGPWDYWVCDYAIPGNWVGERPY